MDSIEVCAGQIERHCGVADIVIVVRQYRIARRRWRRWFGDDGDHWGNGYFDSLFRHGIRLRRVAGKNVVSYQAAALRRSVGAPTSGATHAPSHPRRDG